MCAVLVVLGVAILVYAFPAKAQQLGTGCRVVRAGIRCNSGEVRWGARGCIAVSALPTCTGESELDCEQADCVCDSPNVVCAGQCQETFDDANEDCSLSGNREGRWDSCGICQPTGDCSSGFVECDGVCQTPVSGSCTDSAGRVGTLNACGECTSTECPATTPIVCGGQCSARLTCSADQNRETADQCAGTCGDCASGFLPDPTATDPATAPCVAGLRPAYLDFENRGELRVTDQLRLTGSGMGQGDIILNSGKALQLEGETDGFARLNLGSWEGRQSQLVLHTSDAEQISEIVLSHGAGTFDDTSRFSLSLRPDNNFEIWRNNGGWGTAPVLALNYETGRVGIGTTTPGAPLHVTSGTDAVGIQATVSSGVNTGAGVQLTNSNGRGRLILINTGGRPAFDLLSTTGGWRIDADDDINFMNSGNVGIGTITPDSRLTIVQADTTTNQVANLLRLAHSTSGVVGTGFGTGIAFWSDRIGATDTVQMGQIDSTAGVDDGSRFSIRTRVSPGTLTEILSINEAGDVRLVRDLDVGGVVRVQGDPRAGAGLRVGAEGDAFVWYADAINNGVGIHTGGNLRFAVDRNNDEIPDVPGTEAGFFFGRGVSPFQEWMRIRGGNVAIGTDDTLAARLNVEGTGRISGDLMLGGNIVLPAGSTVGGVDLREVITRPTPCPPGRLLQSAPAGGWECVELAEGGLRSLTAGDGIIITGAGNTRTVAVADDVVRTTGAYADPGWITTLGFDKLRGLPDPCPDGQFVRSIDDVGIFQCDTPPDTTGITDLTAGAGVNITGTGATRTVALGRNLCGIGDYARGISDAGSVVCAAPPAPPDLSDVVSTSGTYADPVWITSLAWSKISDYPSTTCGLGDYVRGINSDGRVACAALPESGLTGLTAGSGIAVTGSGATRTIALDRNLCGAGDYAQGIDADGRVVCVVPPVPPDVSDVVRTSGIYADPAWLTTLAWGKLRDLPDPCPADQFVRSIDDSGTLNCALPPPGGLTVETDPDFDAWLNPAGSAPIRIERSFTSADTLTADRNLIAGQNVYVSNGQIYLSAPGIAGNDLIRRTGLGRIEVSSLADGRTDRSVHFGLTATDDSVADLIFSQLDQDRWALASRSSAEGNNFQILRTRADGTWTAALTIDYATGNLTLPAGATIDGVDPSSTLTDVTAGTGIEVTGTGATRTIAVDDAVVSRPDACNAGQILQRTAAGWDCVALPDPPTPPDLMPYYRQTGDERDLNVGGLLRVAGGIASFNGSVGVGIDSPEERLHVSGGNARIDGNLVVSGTVNSINLADVLTGLTAGTGIEVTGTGPTRTVAVAGDVLRTTGTYADPIWLESLAWGKITGFPGGTCGAGEFVNAVDASGAATCAAPPPTGLTGTGTVNTLAQFNTDGTLGNSPLVLESGTLRVGTAGASVSVAVTGNVSATGCVGPVYVSAGTSDDGNPGSYTAANALCPEGTHVCTTSEALTSINCGALASFAPALDEILWISNGAPSLPTPTNDCRGWTSTSSRSFGIVWRYQAGGGEFLADACNNSHQFACCR